MKPSAGSDFYDKKKFLCLLKLFSSTVNSPTVTAEFFHLNKNV